MTLLTKRAVFASLALAFIVAAPSAHAFVYNNPPTATGAITTSGSRCTGPMVASLGGSSGTGSAPAWTTLAWAYLDPTNLPVNYNNGSYCIDAVRTITIDDGGGNQNAAAAVLALGGGSTSWDITYTLHSGSGITSNAGMYSLTYTPANPAPTATLSASPASINSGNSSVLTWNSTNATSCTGTGFATGNATFGSVSVTPANTTTYSVSCTGAGGTSPGASATVTVTYSAPPAITSFTVTPNAVSSGSAVTISWAATNADYCSSTQFDTEGAISGSKTVNPTTTTTYTITCTGPSGTGTGTWQYRSSDLTDLSCPWTDHNRPYSSMPECTQTSGSCTNPPDKHCKVNTSGGGNGASCIVATDVYYCAVSGPTPSVSESRTVTVSSTAPVATLTASPAAISPGESTVLTWTSSNAVSCESEQFATGGLTSGSVTVAPGATTGYSITCQPSVSGSGSGTWASGEWWTGGTSVVIYQEEVADNGQQGDLCASAAGTEGYSAWNASISRFPYRCGDAGCDLAMIKCYGITGATGTVSKPVAQSGRCETQFPGCSETGYFRSASGTAVPPAVAQATVALSCGASDYHLNQWYTGGTSAGSWTDRAARPMDCAAHAGGSATTWNREVRFDRGPFGIGVEDPYTTTCTYLANPTGTVAKPPSSINNVGNTGAGSDYSYDSGSVSDTCLTASCSGSPANATIGQAVTWTANASGGTTPYVYEWSGTDNLTGTSASVQKTYTTAGAKTASVTVFSPRTAKAEAPERFALETVIENIRSLFVHAAHALTTGTCGGSFTGGGDTDCPGTAADTGGGTGGYNYVTVQCDADSDPTDGVVTVGGPTATLTNNGPITSGNAATLTWSSTGATSCTGTGFNTGGATSGSVSTGVLTNPPQPSYNYSVSCSGAVANTTVSLTNPTAYILATPDRVNVNGTTALTWSAAQVTSCTVTGTDGYSSGAIAGPTIATSTPVSRTITKQTTFTISCDGAAASDNVVVNVVPRFEEF